MKLSNYKLVKFRKLSSASRAFSCYPIWAFPQHTTCAHMHVAKPLTHLSHQTFQKAALHCAVREMVEIPKISETLGHIHLDCSPSCDLLCLKQSEEDGDSCRLWVTQDFLRTVLLTPAPASFHPCQIMNDWQVTTSFPIPVFNHG